MVAAVEAAAVAAEDGEAEHEEEPAAADGGGRGSGGGRSRRTQQMMGAAFSLSMMREMRTSVVERARQTYRPQMVQHRPIVYMGGMASSPSFLVPVT